jgi:Tfp pilus assembly protein PilV
MRLRISDFGFRISRDAAGFTLIEVIIIIVMVSVFMAAIALPLLNSLRESDMPEVASIAYFLTLEKLEELAAVTTGSISAESKSAVSGYGDYQREVAVCDVDCDTLQSSDCDPASNPEQGSGCRKVTVTVYHAKIPNGVSLVTLRTSYAQEPEEPPTPADYNMCSATSSTDSTGNIYDSGGPSGNYENNEDCTFLISPSGSPSTITLSFSAFETENWADTLYVYDGTSTSGVLLGQLDDGPWIPSNLTATSGSMFLRFESDWGETHPGFAATWTSSP